MAAVPDEKRIIEVLTKNGLEAAEGGFVLSRMNAGSLTELLSMSERRAIDTKIRDLLYESIGGVKGERLEKIRSQVAASIVELSERISDREAENSAKKPAKGKGKNSAELQKGGADANMEDIDGESLTEGEELEQKEKTLGSLPDKNDNEKKRRLEERKADSKTEVENKLHKGKGRSENMRLNVVRDGEGGDSASTGERGADYAHLKRQKAMKKNEDLEKMSESASPRGSIKTGSKTIETFGVTAFKDLASKAYVAVPADQTSRLRSICSMVHETESGRLASKPELYSMAVRDAPVDEIEGFLCSRRCYLLL